MTSARPHRKTRDCPGLRRVPTRRGLSQGFPAAVLLFSLVALGFALTWVETTGPDFQDGTFTDNLYASRRTGGAVEFIPRADLNHDGLIDVVCPDDSGPYLRVFFNSPIGFDSANSRFYTIAGGGGVDLADLDCDGYTDLVHAAWHSRNVVIHWGTSSGPSADDTTWLRTGGKSEAVTVHDFDRDTYLDILATTDSSTVCVFWGSANGYLSANRTVFPLYGKVGHNLEVADFNRDGWPDVASVSWTSLQSAVIYMRANRTIRRVDWLPLSERSPHGITTADFNRDGWLDLVFSGYDTMVTTFIYYGSDSGFTVDNRELIRPGSSYGGSAAGYLDADSTLDLLLFRGDFSSDTTMVPMVYYNDTGSVPHFSDSRTGFVGSTAVNASGGLLADFDQDGSADLLLLDHNRGRPSLVLYGPDWTRAETVPAARSHHGQAREFGSTYDRRHEETYVSSVFDAGVEVLWHTLSWDDSLPGITTNDMAFRTGMTPVPDTGWSDWLTATNGDSLPDSLASRYCQYRSVLGYATPAVLPVLFAVRVDYESLPFLDVGPVAILAPVDTVDSGSSVIPRVVVENFGNRAAVFPVSLAIGASYLEAVEVMLTRGGLDTIEFPVWVAADTGNQTVTCYTSMTGDANRHNDTLAAALYVKPPPRPDVGPVQLLAPQGQVDSGTVSTPVVIVKNFGVMPVRTPVTLRIGSDYRQTLTDSLEPGEQDTLTFPDWTAQSVGPAPIVCYTELANDGNRQNDTLIDSVRVLRRPVPDVSALLILAPSGFADSGDLITPAAVVRNYGPVEGIFPVVMHIGPDYTATVQETLAPGRFDTLSFSAWTAQPIDTLNVVCFTALSGDSNPANDTARTRVIVQTRARRDVGTEIILAPAGSLRGQDSVRPRALVRNHGTRTEKYFDVRFRIGAVYDRTVNVGTSLLPDSSVEVAFPAWVAVQGRFTASCSTRLAGDQDPTNDKEEIEIEVKRPYLLSIEPDTSGRVRSGERRSYRLAATLSGTAGADVDLNLVAAPPNWRATLLDSLESAPITTLGFLVPGRPYPFVLRVETPAGDMSGAIDTMTVYTFVVRGFVSEDPAVADSAVLTLALVPNLAVHNFPNPLTDSTTFVVGVPDTGRISLTIYNRAGERICRVVEGANFQPGVRLIGWNSRNDAGQPVASGTYRYVLDYTSGQKEIRVAKKLVVVRD